MSTEILNSNGVAVLRDADPGWMTKKELCRRWKVCAKTVERWVSQGKLVAHYFGKRVRFALKDVLAFEKLTGGDCV
jgi:excisionase family DNA binding protein